MSALHDRLPRHALVRVLEVDPELADTIPADETRRAERHLVARATTLLPGPWRPPAEAAGAAGGALGLLILDGLLARRYTVGGAPALELLGPGDLLRPWGRAARHGAADDVRWTAMAPTEVAWLNEEFARAASRWPGVVGQLLARLEQRTDALAHHLAVSHMVGVEVRLVHTLRHLAARWGRVTPDGVLVHLPLTNEMLGAIIGARAPSVSTALRKLHRAGLVMRCPHGAWLLGPPGIGQSLEIAGAVAAS